MVFVYDNDKSEWGNYIRDELLCRFIPCAVSHDVSLAKSAMVCIALMNGEYDPYALIDDRERILLADSVALLDTGRQKGELFRLISRIEDILFIKDGFDPYTVIRGALYDSAETTRYFGRTCYFSATEKLIVRFVALSGETPVTSEQIRAYCLSPDTALGAVAVHINKINRNTAFCSSVKLISSKRKQGYRMALL